ncbi:MAG: ribulose-phosphate 3-epimerase [Arachnia propionica]|nr:MAG: ribulose-phosphate 3-epimerase [Arachnia propionica]
MRITPSILNADFANLAGELGRIPDADGIHVDVMDNHFVPNLTIGLPVIESLRRASDKFLDIHLMIADPDRWAPAYAEAGAESVTFHLEAASAPIRLARELHRLGTRAAVGLNPATDVASCSNLLDEVDMVLLMSVEPGFGGQPFLEVVLPKITELKRRLGDRDVWIQIDGGISPETIERCAEAGADTFVAGSAVYSAAEPNDMVNRLRDLAVAACGH